MAFEAITTQEQLDAVIEARLGEERKKYEGFDDFKDKAGKYDDLVKTSNGYANTITALKKEIDGDNKNPGYKKQLEDLQGKVKTYEINDVKMRIAHENGIPYEMAGRLAGEDEASIRKDAESMAKYLSSSRRTVPLASTEPTTVDSKKAAIKNMLAGLKGE